MDCKNVFSAPEFQRIRPTFRCRIGCDGLHRWTVQVQFLIVFKQHIRRRHHNIFGEPVWAVATFYSIDEAAEAVIEYVDYCEGGWFDWLFCGVWGYKEKK
jgi:hypothetical protein